MADSRTSGALNSGYALPASPGTISPAAGSVRAAAVAANPSSYQLPAQSRSIVDQHDVPCCVSCALGTAVEILNPSYPPLSPLFHYYVTRYEAGGADPDGSLVLTSALGTLATRGICSARLHNPPFSPAGAATVPTPEARADGQSRALVRRGVRRRYMAAAGPSRAAWTREQLANNHPVVIGILLPQGYPQAFLNSKYEWLNPDSAKASTSGHCLAVVGFSDIRQAVHVQDCRGNVAMDGGRWWLGYRVLDSSFVLEAYSLIP